VARPTHNVSKIVSNGQNRGGICFEHNGLLLWVLETLGFECTTLHANSNQDITGDAFRALRTHVMIVVKLDGNKYLVDAGASPSTVFFGFVFLFFWKNKSNGRRNNPF
jgi:arylamine N-acetyltransferase